MALISRDRNVEKAFKSHFSTLSFVEIGFNILQYAPFRGLLKNILLFTSNPDFD